MTTDKIAAPSSDGIQEESWMAKIWKHLMAEEAFHRATQAPEGPREAAAPMLAMESRGDLPTFRTSC